MLDNLQAEIEAIVNPVFERSDEQLMGIIDDATGRGHLGRWYWTKGNPGWVVTRAVGLFIEHQEAALEKQRKQVIETETKLALRRRQRGEE